MRKELEIAFLNIGTVLTVIAAILISLNIGLFVSSYILFLIGSISFVVYGYLSKNKQLLIMNFIFSIININGILNFL